MKALHLTSHTLVGYSDRDRPQQGGNCFSVLTDADGTERRVLNFNMENLKALEALGLSWPIAVEPVGGRCVVIMDGRIGERWYDKEYCTVCCPQSLLPITQRQRQQRDVMRGNRIEHEKFVQINFAQKADFP